MDVFVARTPISGRGQLEDAVISLHRDDSLHGSLAKRSLAANHGTMVVLQTSGNDLAGAGLNASISTTIGTSVQIAGPCETSRCWHGPAICTDVPMVVLIDS